MDTTNGETIAPVPRGHCDAVHDHEVENEIARYNTLPRSTWNVPIHIFHSLSEKASDHRYSAIGRFDSQSPLDLMSSTYAANRLGLRFDNATREEVGQTITGEIVYSIGKVPARWAPEQDTSLSSPSGEKLTVYAKTHFVVFDVIKADHFDVYIGHPSLERHNLYGDKPKLLNPFRSSPPAPATPAQDQDYLQRLEEERKLEEQFKQQQVRSTTPLVYHGMANKS